MTDENGTVHTLARFLGGGGQGEAWLTSNGRRVVKLCGDTRRAEQVRRQIAFVKRADLAGLHVAKPLAVLRPPECGYVAEFLTDMVPIRTLLAPPRGQPLSAWYLSTGGLRRRLRLLAHAGEAIAGLHARGLIYGDVSHTNVFVSAPVAAEEAWLIDLDNLRSDNDPEHAVYTRGYGAPEILTGGKGMTSYSDAWAFAVLAFQTLSLVHPLLGDMVSDGEPELENDAFEGRIPWIDDSADARNRCSTGLARSMVLSKKLAETAARMFEAGRLDRTCRPGVSTWVERLHVAADRTLRCSSCSATYFENVPACPWCAAPRARPGVVQFQRWDPGKGVVPAMGVVAQVPLLSEPLTLTRRLAFAETGVSARRAVATLEPSARSVTLRPAAGQACWVTDAGDLLGARPREIGQQGTVLSLGPIERSWLIHFEPIDTSHRVAMVGGAP